MPQAFAAISSTNMAPAPAVGKKKRKPPVKAFAKGKTPQAKKAGKSLRKK